MFTVQQSVTIQRPVSDVFAFVADPVNIPRWRPDVVETKAAGKALQLGGRFDEVINFGGRKAQTFEVTKLQPNTSLEVTAVAGLGIRPVQSYTFTAANGQTTMTICVQVRTQGLFRLMEPLLPRMIAAKWRGYAKRLREVMSSTQT
ncbi:MAG: SRPBCC family protein [Chloroflexota bacterium]|nr:SRPBCC family protein [Chloroflexota bacterium]